MFFVAHFARDYERTFVIVFWRKAHVASRALAGDFGVGGEGGGKGATLTFVGEVSSLRG